MFKEELSRFIQKVKEVRGIALIGLDGIPIEKIAVDQTLNMEALSAEYIALLKKAMNTNREFGGGEISEFSCFADRLLVIIRSVADEYFLIVALSPTGNFGKVRFELRKLIPKFAAEVT